MSGALRPGRVLRKPPDSAIGEVPGPFLSLRYWNSAITLLDLS